MPGRLRVSVPGHDDGPAGGPGAGGFTGPSGSFPGRWDGFALLRAVAGFPAVSEADDDDHRPHHEAGGGDVHPRIGEWARYLARRAAPSSRCARVHAHSSC